MKKLRSTLFIAAVLLLLTSCLLLSSCESLGASEAGDDTSADTGGSADNKEYGEPGEPSGGTAPAAGTGETGPEASEEVPVITDPEMLPQDAANAEGRGEIAQIDLPEPERPEVSGEEPLEGGATGSRDIDGLVDGIVPHMPEPPAGREAQKPSNRRAAESAAEQRESPSEQRESPAEQRESPAEQHESPAEQRESPVEQRESPAEQRESPSRSAAAADASREDRAPESKDAPEVRVPEVESSSGRRNVWANPGDTVDLFFPGRGWVYDQSSSSAGGVDFQKRYYDEERTEFVFKVSSPGSFQLSFFREDLGTGEQEKRIVDLISSAAGRPSGSEEVVLRQSGSEEPAQETGSAVDRIESAVARSDADILSNHVEELSRWAAGDEVTEIPSTGEKLEIVLAAAQLLSEEGYEHEAVRILDRSLENGSVEEDQLEQIYFSLGKLYEKPGPVRDEPTAVGYYRKVVSRFPSGVHWQEAKERIRYLERHYLQLR